MRRGLIVTIMTAAMICMGISLSYQYSASAAAEKWVVAMAGFCSDSMVRDVKEEVSVGKSEFDQYCKKAGMKTAIDARCNNNNLEVKCR